MKLNMEQSSQNENRINNEDGCEIIIDDVMEEEIIRDPSENHDSLQTNVNVNLERKHEMMKDNLKKLHVQRNKWKSHNRNAIC
jgi:hypothetical protein